MALDFPSLAEIPLQSPTNTFSPDSTPKSTTNGLTYLWNGQSWDIQVPTAADDAIAEAPIDNFAYNRKNAGWERVGVINDSTYLKNNDPNEQLMSGSLKTNQTMTANEFVGDLDGNATSANVSIKADRLTTSRKLWGNGFNGTSDVSGLIEDNVVQFKSLSDDIFRFRKADGSAYGVLRFGDLTSNRIYDFPDGGGVVAMTEDITALEGDVVKLSGNQTVAGVKTFTSPIVGDLQGKADSAVKLENTRKIWGNDFDGTGNVTGVIEDNLVEFYSTGAQNHYRFYNNSKTFAANLNCNNLTANRVISFPDRAGQIALTTDIPENAEKVYASVFTGVNSYRPILQTVADSDNISDGYQGVKYSNKGPYISGNGRVRFYDTITQYNGGTEVSSIDANGNATFTNITCGTVNAQNVSGNAATADQADQVKVQKSTTNSIDHRLTLVSSSNANTQISGDLKMSNLFKANPSTGQLTANKFTGDLEGDITKNIVELHAKGAQNVYRFWNEDKTFYSQLRCTVITANRTFTFPDKGGTIALEGDYAPVNHNHDGDYAPVNHNHDSDYAPVNHNHNGDYAPVNHNHKGVYAPVNHNHNGDYAPIVHNHDGVYSSVNHHHNGVYAPASHGHSVLTGSDATYMQYAGSNKVQTRYEGVQVNGQILTTDPQNSTANANTRLSQSGWIQRINSTRASKTNIQNVEELLAERFLELANPVAYDSVYDGEGRYLGFIAEEMAEVAPLLTEFDDETGLPRSVAYDRVPAVLTKIAQLQAQKIKDLESRLSAAGL